MTLLRIDIASDVVCPWCVVGYRQLELALERTGTEARIRWHAFELNPGMPPEGQNLREHIMQKYGTSLEESQAAREMLVSLGEELGFVFRYSDDSRMWNTFRAHQLLYWAGGQERQTELKLALFESYFTLGENVDDPQVLSAVAGRAGLDPEEAAQVLVDGRFEQAVRSEERLVTGQGIHAVPAMVFAERYLVSGAQGTDLYVQFLDRLREERVVGSGATAR